MKEGKKEPPISPFSKYIGVRVLEIRDGYARYVLPIKDKLLHIYGGLHGGVIASLADISMAAAVLSILDHERRIATVNLNMQYVAPVKEGEVFAEARVVERKRGVVFAEVTIYNKNREITAKGSGIFHVYRER